MMRKTETGTLSKIRNRTWPMSLKLNDSRKNSAKWCMNTMQSAYRKNQSPPNCPILGSVMFSNFWLPETNLMMDGRQKAIKVVAPA